VILFQFFALGKPIAKHTDHIFGCNGWIFLIYGSIKGVFQFGQPGKNVVFLRVTESVKQIFTWGYGFYAGKTLV